jgi:hypothetical protein
VSAHPRYETHPASEVVPLLLEGEAFDALVADIKANGLIIPITLLDGRILEARNRMRACWAAGTEPRFVEFVGGDPIVFITSANIERTHMHESQRGMRAARLAPLHFMTWRDLCTLRRGSAIEGTTRRAVCRKRQRDARIFSSRLVGAARGRGGQGTSIGHIRSAEADGSQTQKSEVSYEQ